MKRCLVSVRCKLRLEKRKQRRADRQEKRHDGAEKGTPLHLHYKHHHHHHYYYYHTILIPFLSLLSHSIFLCYLISPPAAVVS